jgi:predicted PurR-regulated permease PerM
MPSVLDRWRDYRRTQIEALRESNHPHHDYDLPEEQAAILAGLLVPETGRPAPGAAATPGVDGAPREAEQAGTATSPAAPGRPAPLRRPTAPGGPIPIGTARRGASAAEPGAVREQGSLVDGAAAPAGAAVPAGDEAPAAEEAPTADESGQTPRFGRAGRPLNRQSPFFMGFVGALGVLTAVLLWQTVGKLTTVIMLLLISFFLTLALNPLVEFLTRRGVKRAAAVALVFLGLVVVFGLIALVIVPPVVTQGTELAQKTPGYFDHILKSRWVQDVDAHYHVIDKARAEFNKRITDGNFLSQVFGGVLGVGAAVIGGVFQFFTVLVLTLFLLSSLPRVKQAAYNVVPASRRLRVASLSEEIMRRTGSYAIGQVAVATINAFCSWIMMMIVGIPYAAVLAVAVGFLGLIPMVGATLGASLVCLVAVFDEPRKAIIALVYYVVYQQVENYVVMPRIMRHTVSVPGAVTVVAALAGGTLAGVMGALLAIPVAAGLLLLYEEVLLPRQHRH